MHEQLQAHSDKKTRVRWLAAQHLGSLYPNCSDRKEVEQVVEEMRRQVAYYYGLAELTDGR